MKGQFLVKAEKTSKVQKKGVHLFNIRSRTLLRSISFLKLNFSVNSPVTTPGCIDGKHLYSVW